MSGTRSSTAGPTRITTDFYSWLVRALRCLPVATSIPLIGCISQPLVECTVHTQIDQLTITTEPQRVMAASRSGPVNDRRPVEVSSSPTGYSYSELEPSRYIHIEGAKQVSGQSTSFKRNPYDDKRASKISPVRVTPDKMRQTKYSAPFLLENVKISSFENFYSNYYLF